MVERRLPLDPVVAFTPDANGVPHTGASAACVHVTFAPWPAPGHDAQFTETVLETIGQDLQEMQRTPLAEAHVDALRASPSW